MVDYGGPRKSRVCSLGGEMEVLMLVTFALGVVLYLYTRSQIKEMKGDTVNARTRSKGGHSDPEQQARDIRHLTEWAARIELYEKIKKLSAFVGIVSIVSFLAIRAVQWAVVYGWIR
jgi:hypothetical protein